MSQTPKIDWDTNDPEENLVWAFWYAAQGWAVNHYGDLVHKLPELNIVDVQVIATDVLEGVWEKFKIIELERPEARKNVFWHFVKRQIGWAFSSILRDRDGLRSDSPLTSVNSEGDEYESPEVARSQIHQGRTQSLLMMEMVEAFAAMHPAQQITLALRFFEDMSTEEAAAVMGVSPSTMRRSRRDAEVRMLYSGLMLTGNYRQEPPEDPKPAFLQGVEVANEWVSTTIGCTIDQYLAYIRACFAVDPFYLVEILEEANGIVKLVGTRRVARAMVRNGRALTDDQVRAIRARLAEGVMQKTVAAEFGTTPASISLIRNRKTYDYVV